MLKHLDGDRFKFSRTVGIKRTGEPHKLMGSRSQPLDQFSVHTISREKAARGGRARIAPLEPSFERKK
jgi:hypothetical protein